VIHLCHVILTWGQQLSKVAAPGNTDARRELALIPTDVGKHLGRIRSCKRKDKRS